MTRNTKLVIGAAVAILVVGVVLSQFTSTQPDGLVYVAEQEGFADQADDHSLADSGFAGYGAVGMSRSIAAGVGIALTIGVGYGLFKVIGRREHPTSED